jgi:hypothetical protein
MAIEKVINIEVKSNIENANNGIDKLKSGLKGATKESTALGETMQGSKQSEFINQLGDGIGKLNPAFGSAVKGANGLILKMWEMVANPVGAILAGIVITAKFLYEAFQSSVAGGKELKSIFAGIEAVGTQVKDAIFGLGRALIDVTSAAYKFITLDFSGAAEDMKKANNEASNSYKQLGNAVDGTTFKIAKNLETQQQMNDKARKMQAVVQSETNKLLVQSREILTDETASIKDKKKALEEVTKAETASSKEKERIALKDLQIAKVRAKAMGGEEEKKAKAELRELEIAYNEAQTENAMTGIKLNKQRKMLLKQETADAKEESDKQKEILKTKTEAEKEALKVKQQKQKENFDLEKASVDEQLKNTKISIDEKRNIVLNDNKLSKKDRQKFLIDLQNQEIQIEENHNKAIADLNKRYDDEKANRLADTAVKKEELAYQKSLTEIDNLANTEVEKQTLIEKLNGEHKERMQTANKADAKTQLDIEQATAAAKQALFTKSAEVLSKGADLLGKNTAAGKSMAVAAALINTYQGITTELATKTVTPFEIGLKIANVAIIAATGFKAVKDIISVPIPGGGGGGSAPSGAGIGSTTAPQFNIVGNSGTNQIAQAIGGQQQQPIQAYVVAGAVTTGQALNRSIIANASMG